MATMLDGGKPALAGFQLPRTSRPRRRPPSNGRIYIMTNEVNMMISEIASRTSRRHMNVKTDHGRPDNTAAWPVPHEGEGTVWSATEPRHTWPGTLYHSLLVSSPLYPVALYPVPWSRGTRTARQSFACDDLHWRGGAWSKLPCTGCPRSVCVQTRLLSPLADCRVRADMAALSSADTAALSSSRLPLR